MIALMPFLLTCLFFDEIFARYVCVRAYYNDLGWLLLPLLLLRPLQFSNIVTGVFIADSIRFGVGRWAKHVACEKEERETKTRMKINSCHVLQQQGKKTNREWRISRKKRLRFSAGSLRGLYLAKTKRRIVMRIFRFGRDDSGRDSRAGGDTINTNWKQTAFTREGV